MLTLATQNLNGFSLKGNSLGVKMGDTQGFTPTPPPSPIPGLQGIVAMYMGKGLTNDQMKENPIWKDMSGLGNDLQMKNFSWSLGSGCGLYTQNYNEWRGTTGYAEFTQTSSSIHITNIKNGSLNIYYQLINGIELLYKDIFDKN